MTNTCSKRSSYQQRANLGAFDAYPDWPKQGVIFYDVHGLLRKPSTWAKAILQLADQASRLEPDLLLAIDSRGFLIASPVAMALSLPFALARKPGKLPGECEHEHFFLEYGEDRLEVQKAAIQPGARVIIVDDVVATGGTAMAAKLLLDRLGAEPIAVMTLLEIPQLGAEGILQLPILAWAGT